METIWTKAFGSNFTRFYEGYLASFWFNFDVRKCQFDDIISNQITRKDAKEIIKNPPLNKMRSLNDYNYVVNKLNLSNEEFRQFENSEKKYYYNYKNLHHI